MMTATILLVHAQTEAVQPLADHFLAQGKQVLMLPSAEDALRLVGELRPELVSVDLHLPGSDWIHLIQRLRQRLPATRILITNQYPDLRRELVAKELGCLVFLRQPFTPVWIERALHQLASDAPRQPVDFALPRVRLPVRLKLILPFALLALVFALAAGYLISRYVSDSIEDRFQRQLVDAATLTQDWMVREENRLLETVRAVAHTTGLAEALAAGDPEGVRRLVLPITVNAQAAAVEVLDPAGISLLALRQRAPNSADYAATRGDAAYVAWPFVGRVLAARADAEGDKFAGVVEAPWGLYFYVGGPVYDEAGRLAGAVLVGQPLTMLADRIRAETLAHVTFYTAAGAPTASTLAEAEAPLPTLDAEAARTLQSAAEAQSFFRSLSLVSGDYREVVAGWAARNGEALGLVGTALAQNNALEPTAFTQAQSVLAVLMGTALVIAIGWVLADHITRPLSGMVRAARDVAQGNFQVKLHDTGSDEVGVLVQAFNRMVTGLQEGSIYRDLLGRTVSPEVREQLRDSFAAGDLHLEGQTATATVLMTDIRGFTTLSEKTDPQTVLKWLNEYFSELAPVISAHGGVIDKYEGDAMLAFFGVLPRPMPPRESAFHACRAALEMLRVINAINERRLARGEPVFVTGIGINTGKVTAGGLGAADRLNYTIIGDVVNTTQRIESFTRQFDESAIVISESTHGALRGRQALFTFASLGAHTFKGKSEPVTIYHLQGGELAPALAAAEGDDDRYPLS